MYESDLVKRYNQMLDDNYGEIAIAGSKWPASTVLKRVDPTAYEVGLSEFKQELDDK